MSCFSFVNHIRTPICVTMTFFLTLRWLIRAITQLIISEWVFFLQLFSLVWIIPVFSWWYGIFFRISICRLRSWVVQLYMTRIGNSGFLNNVCYLNLCNFIVFFTAVVCMCEWVWVCACTLFAGNLVLLCSVVLTVVNWWFLFSVCKLISTRMENRLSDTLWFLLCRACVNRVCLCFTSFNSIKTFETLESPSLQLFLWNTPWVRWT